MPTTDFKSLVTRAIENGDVVAQQTKGEYAYFKFNGGMYHGCELRLYPPFEPFTVTTRCDGNGGERSEQTWRLARNFKNDKQTRSTYNLVDR